jgi:protein-glutamine gamma-glutamyltransferase
MRIQRAAPVNEWLAKLIFLIAPTLLICYLLLQQVNTYYSVIKSNAFQLALYLSAGMLLSAVFYAFRFRFLPTLALLVVGLYAVYKGLDKYATGEFDMFFLNAQYTVYAVIFTIGWICGWGFLRVRYFAIIISVLLLSLFMVLIGKLKPDDPDSFLRAFLPVLIYAVYLIFTAEQIYNYNDKTGRFWWFMTRRVVLFGLLIFLLLSTVLFTMKRTIKDTVTQAGASKNKNSSMLNKNKDNTFDLMQYMQLRSQLHEDTELLFCAHINSYFPHTNQPNPLYLTAFYFTRFDTISETFERDSAIPYNDLFEPDPSKVPLFSTKVDTTVIPNSLGDKFRTIVDVEIYNHKLSRSMYLAPNVGYFVQPVTVEKNFRGEFSAAFRAKSYVSELNSAYFVYNLDRPDIRQFQEMRFNVLRQVKDYQHTDSTFFKYYTYMPGSDRFKPISSLAHKIADKAKTPVDKMLAIRDYFLSKDENGDPLYKYTTNPGEPGIPDASKLLYFIQESHKGYCAYYAGATLFMLRALGIPSRIAVGFLTEDRSDKNKGWYWYYANQAHAWVQVYFPGFGWLDFDTTVGNSDQRESPKPDGTPPMQPPKAYLAADGIVEDVDTLHKRITMRVQHYLFHDKDYQLDKPTTIHMDMKVAVVYRDSADVPLYDVRAGDEGTAVSYAEAFKNMEPSASESAASLIRQFPDPAPVDELYLKKKDLKKPDDQPVAEKIKPRVSWTAVLWTCVSVLGGLLLLAFLMPSIILAYYKVRYDRASAAGNKAYWAYRAATYYLHQTGLPRGTLTPMQYAREKVDPTFGTNFAAFMNVYLKQKYAQQPLTALEQQQVSGFLKPFLNTVRSQIKSGTRFWSFLKPVRTVGFYVMPEEEV